MNSEDRGEKNHSEIFTGLVVVTRESFCLFLILKLIAGI